MGCSIKSEPIRQCLHSITGTSMHAYIQAPMNANWQLIFVPNGPWRGWMIADPCFRTILIEIQYYCHIEPEREDWGFQWWFREMVLASAIKCRLTWFCWLSLATFFWIIDIPLNCFHIVPVDACSILVLVSETEWNGPGTMHWCVQSWCNMLAKNNLVHPCQSVWFISFHSLVQLYSSYFWSRKNIKFYWLYCFCQRKTHKTTLAGLTANEIGY